MILVTGGAGNVGATVVRQLLDAGEKVRVITRNPRSRSFPDQVEVVPGDLTRPETLPAALSGVDRVFLFPVFNGLDGFLEAARQVDLQHVVLLSSSAVTYSPPGWIGEQHLQLERAVAASGLPWTYVRPDAFMTNDLVWKHQIVNGGVVRADGSATFTGVERIHGSLDGRAGSFTLTATGSTDTASIAHGRREVVTGSGTGELKGLRGHGKFTAMGHRATIRPPTGSPRSSIQANRVRPSVTFSRRVTSL